MGCTDGCAAIGVAGFPVVKIKSILIVEIKGLDAAFLTRHFVIPDSDVGWQTPW